MLRDLEEKNMIRFDLVTLPTLVNVADRSQESLWQEEKIYLVNTWCSEDKAGDLEVNGKIKNGLKKITNEGGKRANLWDISSKLGPPLVWRERGNLRGAA